MRDDAIAPQEAPPGLLPPEGVRRLLASLILAEQQAQIAAGQMPRGCELALQDPRLTPEAQDDLTVDEAGLGFDSLSRLSLVLRLNRFFGLATTGVEDYLLVQRRFGDWLALLVEHQRLVGPDLVLTFDTSGSSGPVKHVAHPIAALQAEVSAHLKVMTPPRRILTLVPPHHIYGCLFTVLLPARLAIPVVELHRLPPTAAPRQAREGDLVIGTPFTWDLVQKSGLRFAPGVRGLTSAGPSNAATFDLGCGLASMTEVYGATETGGIATRSDFGADFSLLPHVTRDGEGIRGPSGALDLQDRLVWRDDGCFALAGRHDDVVQVAGVNVSPAHLAGILLAVEGVAEAAVRPTEGRLKAFLVARAPRSEVEPRVLAALAALPAPLRPGSLTWGPALPRSAMGKLCDWTVGDQVGVIEP